MKKLEFKEVNRVTTSGLFKTKDNVLLNLEISVWLQSTRTELKPETVMDAIRLLKRNSLAKYFPAAYTKREQALGKKSLKFVITSFIGTITEQETRVELPKKIAAKLKIPCQQIGLTVDAVNVRIL